MIHMGASYSCAVKVAATVAAGAIGAIKTGKPDHPAGQEVGEEKLLVCVNMSMTKTTLEVAVCALPTDVAYNRWVAWLSPTPGPTRCSGRRGVGAVYSRCWRLLFSARGGMRRGRKGGLRRGVRVVSGGWYDGADGAGRVVIQVVAARMMCRKVSFEI